MRVAAPRCAWGAERQERNDPHVFPIRGWHAPGWYAGGEPIDTGRPLAAWDAAI